ncbi:efflux RND transporter periplasmic adaptor subunit [Lichenihabitans psoromatis]|uniref:efflux RND transporter periplasmic adaptor subunit n=1 Tax=Lichenihabitans psoromatis TaxID=2528642 RepID=UPI001035D43D|nr:efflux RND transporter periplasmic adaptor subunit [Lichenihabitans psoromatis]
MSNPSDRKGRGFSRLILVAIVIAAAVGVYEFRNNDAFRAKVYATAPFLKPADKAEAKAAPPPMAVPVSAVAAQTGDFPVILVGLGTVQANNTVLVRSRVDGQIIKINFTEGQIVKKGDLLVQIDPRPYKAALEQAQAKKQQDQANLANANRDLTRYESLAKNDYATKQQLDTQTSQVAQLTAQIAADDAAIDNAQVQLDYATITAPITGRVGFRLADQGNIVTAASATGIVSIAQLQPIAAIFTEPENSLGQLQAGVAAGPVPVNALTTDGKTVLAEGTLDTLNNEVDTSSGTIRVKALFKNEDNKLWPGLSVTTRTTVAIRKDVVMIPEAAVQRGQTGFYAFVVGPDNKVQQRNLKIGLIGDGKALIQDGIKADEMVVTAGQYRLQPGVLVKVGDDQQKTAAKEP